MNWRRWSAVATRPPDERADQYIRHIGHVSQNLLDDLADELGEFSSSRKFLFSTIVVHSYVTFLASDTTGHSDATATLLKESVACVALVLRKMSRDTRCDTLVVFMRHLAIKVRLSHNK